MEQITCHSFVKLIVFLHPKVTHNTHTYSATAFPAMKVSSCVSCFGPSSVTSNLGKTVHMHRGQHSYSSMDYQPCKYCVAATVRPSNSIYHTEIFVASDLQLMIYSRCTCSYINLPNSSTLNVQLALGVP